MRLDADRPHARTAAAMRNAEGLVQVEVGNVRTDIAGTGKADHGVHVGAIKIDLTTVFVGDLANLANRLLEHTVSGRVCDHAAREVFRILLCFCTEILDVNVTVVPHLHRHHFHADHLC
ncbi:hypothetical protein D3C80_1190640 [compost metagenome]